MNLLECTIIEIISPPYFMYRKWWVKVKYTCYGQENTTPLMFDTEELSKSVKVGDIFLG